MKRSSRVPWSEVRIGVVILFAFAVLLWAAFNGSGMTFFQKSNSLTAYFDDVAGLATGAPVWLGGIEVGHVSGIKFVEQEGQGKIRVDLAITEEAWPLVSAQSAASIGTMGLMGDKYVSLAVRAPGEPPATDGAVLPTAQAGDLTAAFSDAPEMMANLNTTIKHLNTVLERVDAGQGYLGRLTTNSRSSDEIDSLVRSSRQLMTEMTKSQRRLVGSIETASNAFDSLTTGVLHGGGTLSKLVWDTTLYAELSSISTRMDNMVAQWEQGRGTVHQLMTDSTMYLEVRDLVSDTRALLDDIMANPRRYFKFSVF